MAAGRGDNGRFDGHGTRQGRNLNALTASTLKPASAMANSVLRLQ